MITAISSGLYENRALAAGNRATSAIRSETDRLNETAGRISRAGIPPTSETVPAAEGSLIRDIVELRLHQVRITANIRVLQAEDEMRGTLLDIRA